MTDDDGLNPVVTVALGLMVVALIVFVGCFLSGRAYGWQPPGVTGWATCLAQGVQEGNVTAANHEAQAATVRSSTGPVFKVGDVIGAHSAKTEKWGEPGNFVGNVTVTFAVNFPSDHILRTSTVTVHFPGGCHGPTTTTTQPSTTTTQPHVTTTTGHSTTTTGHATTTLPPPPSCDDDTIAVCTEIRFTG